MNTPANTKNRDLLARLAVAREDTKRLSESFATPRPISADPGDSSRLARRQFSLGRFGMLSARFLAAGSPIRAFYVTNEASISKAAFALGQENEAAPLVARRTSLPKPELATVGAPPQNPKSLPETAANVSRRRN